jgi:hypothetical protein
MSWWDDLKKRMERDRKSEYEFRVYVDALDARRTQLVLVSADGKRWAVEAVELPYGGHSSGYPCCSVYVEAKE